MGVTDDEDFAAWLLACQTRCDEVLAAMKHRDPHYAPAVVSRRLRTYTVCACCAAILLAGLWVGWHLA